MNEEILKIMDDKNLKNNAEEAAKEMHKILMSKLKNKNIEYIFLTITWVFPTLTSRFVDALIQNEDLDQKLKLIDEMAELTKIVVRHNAKELDKSTH